MITDEKLVAELAEAMAVLPHAIQHLKDGLLDESRILIGDFLLFEADGFLARVHPKDFDDFAHDADKRDRFLYKVNHELT